MRYEDASGSFSAVTGNPDARDDADVLPAGSHGPATGNTITGAGTITGLAGADLVPDGTGKIVALEGANGSDQSDGGSLHVGGRYGDLTMDTHGNYKYTPNVETPNGARDVFRYTLADNAGARDAATLTIEIGREPQKIDANAQQIIPGPDGVVTLPPGVELSDVHVVGRNLVIDMPDGTQMVIIDGAVFVPQLVLNGVEVPATNLAALLIDTEPQPAAGIPQSSGGNFDVPVPPLDPGVPLGDLIPPTELFFTPPEFHEVNQFVDEEPEAGTVGVQLDDDAQQGGNPGGIGDDPGGSTANGFLPGSGGDGNLTWDLLSSGAPAGFSYVDGPNGSILVQQVQGAVTVTVLTITIDPTDGSFTVTQNAAVWHAAGGDENNAIFTIGYVVSDEDGDPATGTLTINVDDDTPTVSVTAGPDSEVILTTHDAATIGAASEAVSTSANFGGVFTGTSVSPGADGAGSGTTSGYALSTTGGLSGLTQGGVAINLYSVGGVIVGSTSATSGGITAANTVFTVGVNGTGVVTLTQFSQIDHTNTDPSPTGAPFTDHFISLTDGSITLTRSETVVDRDGDSVTGSASVGIGANLHFVDDGPSINLADRGEPSLTVDETDLGTNATASFAANFGASFGADGPAANSITYALGISAPGANSGLVDVATGQPIVLVQNGAVVEGHVGTAAGALAFTVSVNAAGDVTLNQILALQHPNASDPDDSVTLSADNLVTLTATAHDFDGDTASTTLNIGQDLHFEDDGPSVSNLQPGPGVTLDETTAVTPAGFPISASSASAVITGTTAYGADGAGTTAYGLSVVGGGATTLKTAIGDYAITLVQSDAQTITGQYNDGSVHTAFTVHINADGTITVTESVPLEHNIDGSTPADYNDALNLSGLIDASITVTDRDGDTATGSVGIGGLITFLDDGPSIDVTAGPDANVLLQTQDAETIGGASDTAASTANFSGVFGSITSSGGADGAAGAIGGYTLGVSSSGVDSGLDQSGANIFLYVISGKVVGSTSATIGGVSAGNTVFDVGVSGAGIVTLTQYSQIDHPIAGDPTPSGTPFADQILSMTDSLVTLSLSSTITDNDGDTATDTATVNIGANLQFADDGPDISAVLTGTQIRIDETDGVVAAGGEVDPVGGNLGTVTMSAVSLFTVSTVHASADAPTTNSYALTLSSQGVASGLLLSTTNAPIFLYNISGVISGSTSATLAGVNAGNTVFSASINTGSGAVTLTQFFAVEHTNTASNDEDSTGLAAGVLNVTITATDFDGDTDQASVDLGSVIRFEDDGPTIDVTTNSDAGIFVQTQDADTIGAATDTASSAVNFGGAFNLTSNGGSDGPATTPALGYTLGVSAPGVDSGLDHSGSSIFLYVIGGVVVGSTSATVGGVNAGNTVFDVGVSGTGVVTLTQYSQIDHPLEAGLNNAPFADQIISMTDSLVTLTASSSITDNDGDIAVDSATINIGNNLQFADHGPTATNDVDNIAAGFFGTATGNVLTGLEVAVAEDTNASDGNADNVGADTPGVVSLIASNNVPANTDNVPDGSGNFVVNGQYGELTINANGDYSYDRNDGSAGGVSDVFTYTLRDFDGDTVTATLTINIGVNPPVATTAAATVDDDGLVGANPAGTDDINANIGDLNAGQPGDTEAIFVGQLGVTGGDGDIDFSLIAPSNQTIGQETVSYSLVANVLTATIVTSPDATRVGDPLFTVSLDAETGQYTVTLVDNVLHNNDANENEDGTEVSVNIPYQVVDVGGSVSAANGTLTISFNDDVPSVDVTKGADTGVVLQTQDADTIGGATDTNATSAAFGGVFGLTSVAGADGAAAPVLGYTLGVSSSGVDSGLDQGGSNIFLYVISGKVVGSTSATIGGVTAGNTVFDVGVASNGVVTLSQYSQIDHPAGGDPTPTGTPFVDHIVSMVDSLVTLTASSTITDNDGDSATDSETVNIGANLTFADDGPDISAVLTGTQIRIDETDGVAALGGEVDPVGGNLGTVTMSAVSLFTVSTVHASADAPTTNSYALTLSSQGVASGLLLSTTNAPIFLYDVGGVISGSTSATLAGVNAGNTVFSASINTGTGAVTLTQFFAVEHGTPGASYDEDSSGLTAGVLNVTITATDFDGDKDTASVDLGSVIRFEDDGPSIDVTKGADAGVVLQTQDADTIGVATDTNATSANFGGVFAIGSSSGGSDGAAAAPVLGYTLGVSVAGVDSGLDQGGSNIFLYVISGKVVGSTSATLGGVTAGNTVFDVGVSGTGVVTLTQYSQIDHTNVDPTPTGTPFADHIIGMVDSLVTLTASSTITDNDGDTATDSETVNIGANLTFADDGPSAAIVTTGQTVSLDESAGNQADSNDVTGPLAAFAGVANPGDDLDVAGTGPIQFATNASALVAATGSAYGADGAGSTVFGLSVAPGGVDSGLDTTAGTSIFLFKEGDLVVGRVGATAGVAATGSAAFALSINPSTGAVSMVEYLSILHPLPANPDDSVSITNTAVQATVTVTDFDGDTATNSVNIGGLISFQDSAPIMTAAQNMNIQNSGDVAHTAAFAFNLGADGANVSNDVITNVTGSATVGGVAVQNWILTPGAENATTASYSFSFDYPVGGGNTAHETGTLVFDKAAGTYTVDLANPIQGVTTILQTAEGTLFQGYEYGTSTVDGSQPAISVTQIQDLAGTANDIFVQFTSVSEPSSGTGDDNLEVTNWVPGANNPPPVAAGGDTAWNAGQLFNQVDGWVSTSGSANGVDGDTIQGGEVLDFNLVQGPNPTGVLAQPATFAQASAMFLKFDGIGTGEDMIIILKLYDPTTNTYTTRAIMVENTDIQHGPGAGPGQYSGVTLDNNDGLVIIESNDYNNPGENWVIVGAQVAGSDEGVTGTAINLNSAIGAAGDSDVDNNGSLDTDALGFASDTNDGPFKISSIGFLTTSTTPQNAHLDFNVTVTDGDGDSVTQTITADVTAAVDSTSAIALSAAVTTVSQAPLVTKSVVATSEVYHAPQQPVANNNNVLVGAIAAAGLEASTAVAAHDYAPSGHEAAFAVASDAGGGGLVQSSAAQGDDAARTALSGETNEAVDVQPKGGSSSHLVQEAASNSLTAGDSHESQAAAPLLQGTEASAQSAPAQSSFTSGGVGMPSAEMLAAANANDNALEGHAKSTSAVQHVLFDALAGGGHGPNIDAVIDAVANQAHGGGQAAIEALASHGPAAVSGWDMASIAGFTGGHAAFTMEHMALHMDAAPAAA